MATVSSAAKTRVSLVPWDPTSPDHVERLFQQRIACGWDSELVEGWRVEQQTGSLNLQWVVLESSDSETAAKLLKHTENQPRENMPLIDSARSFAGKPRAIPQPQTSFVPVGHICLGHVPAHYDDENASFAEDGLWISSFYVLRAIQSNGLGRAAMDTAETIAISEPLNAKNLGLNAISKMDVDQAEKYTALNLPIPKFSTQEWYERRGYQTYRYIPKELSQADSTGRTWYWDTVCLKKNIV
ncbi:unnamed protein product [Diplocarpon coronariae]